MVLVTSFPTGFSHNKYGASASGFWTAVARRTMATEEATPGSQSEESNALDLPSAFDLRDYVLQRPSQEVNSEAFSSVEAPSFPCSSDVDPVSITFQKPPLPLGSLEVESFQFHPRCGAGSLWEDMLGDSWRAPPAWASVCDTPTH
ncbi:shieldin complex subunit 1 isoform X3 [Manis pentadactyla]|uniref:shieldin complex subunit 1 isoform X3 n=2 Tax=Manis pentadactyla TaxID=143292 RepID=UPI00255CAF71|nr:shieldin complex subunit 1 isoform X3 [Manis pentadactyla]